MSHNILLVDDHRDILRLLHTTLETLKNADLEIMECLSGEEALLEASRHTIDLLVADYLLPGMTGVQLMHRIRVRHPEVKVILTTSQTERKTRDEMLNAGAMAIFNKPIPLADFLDTVERCLGLVRTIFPPEPSSGMSSARHSRLADLLANFRQDINGRAVFLLNDRGRVLVRAGNLHDSSLEVSLLAALMAIYNAGLKVSRYIRQETLDAYYFFRGGEHDLLFIPINSMYALMVAGDDLASSERILETVQALLALRDEVENSLKSLGVTGELTGSTQPEPNQVEASAQSETVSETASPSSAHKKGKAKEQTAAPPASEMENLLEQAGKKIKKDEMDSYWDQAAEKHSHVPANPDGISYEQARKLGLAPDEDEH
jgi:CheY-like chemotaxis protein